MVFDVKIHSSGRTPAAHFHVAMFIRTNGNAFVRQIRHSKQQRLQFGLNRFQARGGGFQFGFDRRDRGHRCLGFRVQAFAFEHADLFADAIALGLQFFGAHLNRFALGFQRLERIDIQENLGIFAGLQSRHDGIEVFAQEGNV